MKNALAPAVHTLFITIGTVFVMTACILTFLAIQEAIKTKSAKDLLSKLSGALGMLVIPIAMMWLMYPGVFTNPFAAPTGVWVDDDPELTQAVRRAVEITVIPEGRKPVLVGKDGTYADASNDTGYFYVITTDPPEMNGKKRFWCCVDYPGSRFEKDYDFDSEEHSNLLENALEQIKTTGTVSWAEWRKTQPPGRKAFDGKSEIAVFPK